MTHDFGGQHFPRSEKPYDSAAKAYRAFQTTVGLCNWACETPVHLMTLIMGSVVLNFAFAGTLGDMEA
jgi:hypothetical protein